MMRKSTWKMLTLIVVLVGGFYEPSSASAATWYIRTDGGDSTQCTGHSDAPYPGSGTGQACAVNHPFWLLPPGRGPIIQGGDTVIIGNGSYRMGLDAPNSTGQTGVCYSAWAYSCVMPPIPSGPDAAHPTRILGKGWDTKDTAPPQLYGVGRAWQVVSLAGSSNVELRYLEITDHTSCIYNSPDPAKRCDRSTAPFGDQADYGLTASDSTNVLIKDVNIHGMSVGGVKAGRLNDWMLDNLTVRGNGFVGWDGDIGHGSIGSGTESSNSGTIHFINSSITYSGCGEQYPSSQIYGCFSQGQGGYGDGLGTYATGGDWIIENSEFSHNVSDGLDLLYHTGNGTITIKRSRFEGNAGNAIKTATNTAVENSILISNCDYFSNNPITETASPGFDHCRAGGTTWASGGWKPGYWSTITNSIVTGTSMILIEVGGSTCDGTEQFISRNNIFLGMESWYKKTHGEPGVVSDLFYLDGSNGNGAGPCGPGNPTTAVKIDSRNSIAYNLKYAQCPNSDNVLCVDPQLITMPPFANANDIHTYGEHWNVAPQGGSPAIDQSSSAVGSVVLGSVVVPSLDILGNSRLANGKITWGAYDPNAVSPDTVAPTPATFNMLTTATSLDVAVTSLTATDNVGVTGYVITESSTQPSNDVAGWSNTAPTTFTFSAPGIRTAYAWAKDAAGNVSNSLSKTVTITLPDQENPVISNFTVTSTASSLTAPITTLSASDNVGVTGFKLTETSSAPLATATDWSASAPTSFTFAGEGSKSLYAWAKDAAGNVSNGIGRTVTITLPDSTLPIMTAFTLPATATSLTVTLASLTATDNKGVTGYLITESATKPAANASGWTASAPVTFTFSAAGARTAYAWARDAAGNVSASRSVTVTITLADTTEPTVSITSPNNSSTVSGTVIVTATATDNVAVAKVELYINDVLTKTDTASPFSFTWDTTSIANGGYSLSFKAYDLSGNSKTSTVTVTVSNKRSVIKRRGDLNGDGKINVTDALLALRLSVGLTPQTVNSMEAGATDDGLDGDVAPLDTLGAPLGDGRVNISDALVLLKHSVGLASW